jgi:type IX secretion system PorP/SprF family membrane protein
MKKIVYIFVLLAVCSSAFSQDTQFSQFYAAPMYHNPAFTGSGYAPRLVLNYRNQWPSLAANYTTSAISVDHYLDRLNSGIGIMVVNDEQGFGRLKNTEISGFYSYQLNIVDDHFLRMGVQGTYSNRSFDTAGLTFPDQFDNGGFTGNPSSDPLYNFSGGANFADFSTGVLYYNPKFYLGASMHHIAQPDLTFTSNAAIGQISDVLPRKIMVNGGLNIPLGELGLSNSGGLREFTVYPAFLYKQQGKFSQLDLGAFITYSPMTLGLWYRGIPLKKNGTNSPNNDAIVALAGFRFDSFSFGYSYDITISGLGSTTGGSHEISIAYQFDAFESERSPSAKRRKKELSCPKF